MKLSFCVKDGLNYIGQDRGDKIADCFIIYSQVCVDPRTGRPMIDETGRPMVDANGQPLKMVDLVPVIPPEFSRNKLGNRIPIDIDKSKFDVILPMDNMSQNVEENLTAQYVEMTSGIILAQNNNKGSWR